MLIATSRGAGMTTTRPNPTWHRRPCTTTPSMRGAATRAPTPCIGLGESPFPQRSDVRTLECKIGQPRGEGSKIIVPIFTTTATNRVVSLLFFYNSHLNLFKYEFDCLNSYLGSNWGATGRDEVRFPKQPAKTYYAGPDDVRCTYRKRHKISTTDLIVGREVYGVSPL